MKRILMKSLFILIIILGGNNLGNATTFYVTNTNGGGAGSYNQAIASANADLSANGVSPHQIEFCTGGVIFSGAYPENYITFNGPKDQSITINGNMYIASGNLGGKAATFNNIVFTGINPGSFGGAIMLAVAGTLNFNNCRFTACSAYDHGGAIFNNGSIMNFDGCTFDNNQTVFSGGWSGGAVHNNGGTVTFRNCTFSNNYTASSDNIGTNGAGGGALMNNAGGNMTVINCTFYNNSSALQGGAIHNRDGATCSISNSIFVGNTAVTTGDLSATFTSAYGNNIITDVTGAVIGGVTTGNNIGVPALAVLNPILSQNADYQFTHDLVPGSPAINPGTLTGAPIQDQRKFGRNGNTDIGAIEYNGINPCLGFSAAINAVPTCYVAPFSLSSNNTGGIAPFTYNWAKNNTIFNCSSTLTNQTEGDYLLTVTDANGCVSKDNIQVISPNIVVTGNGNNIADGDNIPDFSDFTEMGPVEVLTTDSKTYVIENTGTTPLTISSINLSGPNASEFSITSPISFPQILPPAATLNLIVSVTPDGSYYRTAFVNINSDDCDAALFNFTVRCDGQCHYPDYSLSATPMTVPCVGGTSVVNLPNSIVGYDYYLKENGTSNYFGAPQAGTGSGLSFPTDPISSFTIFAIEIRKYQLSVLKCSRDFGNTLGVVVSEPEIGIKGKLTMGGIAIPNGGTANLIDSTDFGISTIGVPISRTFEIANTGTGPLNIISINVSGAGATKFGFSMLTPSSPIPAGISGYITITYTPTAATTDIATITVTNDDCDESTYTFTISGTGTLGSIGSALNVDGNDDYINISNPYTAFTNEMSVELWADFQAGSSKALVYQSSPGVDDMNSNVWFIYTDNSNNFSFYVNDGGTWKASGFVVTNGWHHITGTISPLESKLYVDGSLVGSSSPGITTSITSNPSAVMQIGKDSRYGVGNPFNQPGTYDEIRVWNRALCDSEVLNNYSCEIPTSSPGLVANYHFNQGIASSANPSETLLYDASGFGRNGTLTNIALSGASSNWVTPGGVVNGFNCTPAILPEISLEGAGQLIANGDLTPDLTNLSDFDSVFVSSTVTNTYTIRNTGTANLSLIGSPIIAITGDPDFTVSLQPSNSIVSGGNSSFEITFSPNAEGIRTATVSIMSNDCSDPIYVFAISGIGTLPDIQLSASSTNIPNGGNYTLPNGVEVGNSSTPVSFFINNSIVNSYLYLVGPSYINISGLNASDFSINEVTLIANSGIISPNNPIPFLLTFTPSGIGNRSATITINSNDPDEPSFSFNITATGLEPPEINVKQNLTNLASGDNYDFSNITMTTSSSIISFTVENTSSAGTLNFTAFPSVQLTTTGTPADFTLTSSVPATLAAGASSVFTIRFTPRAAGLRTAQLFISSNDSDEATYLINLSGIGTIIGDINGNGIIDAGEIAGDINQSYVINYPQEITGDINGSGTIGLGEISGDENGDGVITFPEIAGNTNGTGGIDASEITGDADGNGNINGREFVGDRNGNFILDPGEEVGDIDGNGIINAPEVAGDINGDGQIEPEPTYIMVGKNIIATGLLSRYEISPILPEVFNYKWDYSDESMLMIKDTTRYFMDVIANAQTNSGVLYCYVFKFGIPYDTLSFIIDVNKGYINVAELAALTQACANVYNVGNKCEENYIDYFKLADISYENDGCVIGGLQDLTNSSEHTTNLEMGFTYSVELKPKRIFLNALGEPSTLFYALWLDYNNDGDFEDAYEYLKNGESKGELASIINIVIANNETFEGSRRLRVGMRSTGGFTETDACSAVGESGEFEDYTVTLVPMADLSGPNFITPNNDGSNDILVLRGVDINKTRSLTIISNTGSVVYQKEEYANDWTGQGKNGQLLPKGTYYYIFKNGSNEIKSYFELDY